MKIIDKNNLINLVDNFKIQIIIEEINQYDNLNIKEIELDYDWLYEEEEVIIIKIMITLLEETSIEEEIIIDYFIKSFNEEITLKKIWEDIDKEINIIENKLKFQNFRGELNKRKNL